MAGLAIGLETLGLEFMPDKPFIGCRVCGAIYQSAIDRDHPFNDLPEHMALSRAYEAMLRRKEWSQRHARTHTSQEHLNLAMSGAWCTPEAAQKLAACGVIAMSDMIFNQESACALHEGSAVPINDVEGVKF